MREPADRLDTAADHLPDEHAVEMAWSRGDDRVVRRPHLTGVAKTEPDEPELGLVRERRRARLEDDRVADRGGGLHGVIGRVDELLARHSDPVRREQLLAV